MTNKLYVGNLDYSITEDNLKTVFTEYGTVEDVKLIVDKDTNRSKGFAFVTMSTEEEAANAMNNLSNAELEGRPMKVSEARERQERGHGGGRSHNRERGNFRSNRNRY